MKRIALLMAVCVLTGLPCVIASDAEPDTQLQSDENVAAWLTRIEARAQALGSLTAKLRYERIQGLLGDQQIRFGTLAYKAGPPTAFDIHLDRLVVDGSLQKQDQRFTFDGRWLAERIDDPQRNEKTFIRRELVAPDETDRDLLELGDGPFALPLNFNRKTIEQRFVVTLIQDEPSGQTPENSVHLRLIPREHMDIEQQQIDIWYDRDSLLPVQIHTVEDEGSAESIIRLREVATEIDLQSDRFNTSPPHEPGWRVEIKPLQRDASSAGE